MARTGRPPKCTCGNCKRCRTNAAACARYQQLSAKERRERLRRKDMEARRRQDRKRSRDPQRRAKQATYIADWRERNPEKVAAWRAVQEAVRTGELMVPDACERCGSDGPLDAHHADYSKPLEVEWLCKPCHGTTRTVEARTEAA